MNKSMYLDPIKKMVIFQAIAMLVYWRVGAFHKKEA